MEHVMDLRIGEAQTANRYMPASSWANGRTAPGSGRGPAALTEGDHKAAMAQVKGAGRG